MDPAIKTAVGATTILLMNDEDDEDAIMIVDISSDRRKVVVTSPVHREEGSPSSALEFARCLRKKHGLAVDDFCKAIERAAAHCISEEERPS